MNPARVEVTIEELVLHGFAPGDRYAIGLALEQELTRLLVEQGVPAGPMQGRHVERLDGGSFPMTPAARVENVGTQAARAVFGGLQS